MRLYEIEAKKKGSSCRCGKIKCRGECAPKSDKRCRCGKLSCRGECSRRLSEIYKRKDYVRCPDGQRHKWDWNGGFGEEEKTNRNVENHKCANCGLIKMVFCDTGKRVNR